MVDGPTSVLLFRPAKNKCSIKTIIINFSTGGITTVTFSKMQFEVYEWPNGSTKKLKKQDMY